MVLYFPSLALELNCSFSELSSASSLRELAGGIGFRCREAIFVESGLQPDHSFARLSIEQLALVVFLFAPATLIVIEL